MVLMVDANELVRMDAKHVGLQLYFNDALSPGLKGICRISRRASDEKVTRRACAPTKHMLNN